VGRAAGRAARGLFAPVEKWLRKRIATSRRSHHVFRGEVRRTANGIWKAQGWHHRFGGVDPPDRRVTGITEIDVTGAYHARVEMKGPDGRWVTKRAGSTFFPDNWTPQQVHQAIDEAFTASRPEPGTNGRRWLGTSHGLPIAGSYHPNGRTWNSSWPAFRER